MVLQNRQKIKFVFSFFLKHVYVYTYVSMQPRKVTEVAAFLTCILEVLVWNLRQNTDYPDVVWSWVFSVPPGNFWNSMNEPIAASVLTDSFDRVFTNVYFHRTQINSFEFIAHIHPNHWTLHFELP
jgi:hypothetical protein